VSSLYQGFKVNVIDGSDLTEVA